MTRTLLALAAVSLLIAGPVTMAHQGNPTTGVTSTIWGEPNSSCWSTQDPHDYSTDPAGTFMLSVDPTTAEFNIGSIMVIDGSVDDCNGDGLPGGDGDLEFGFGGGAFPREFKPWHGGCRLPANFTPHHSGDTVEVFDWAIGSVKFHVGGDPSEPMIVDNGDGTYSCIGDGCVCPNIDSDDWLIECVGSCTIPASVTFTDALTGLPVTRPTETHWTGHGLVWVFVSAGVLDPAHAPCYNLGVFGGEPGTPWVNPNCASPSVDIVTTGHISWP